MTFTPMVVYPDVVQVGVDFLRPALAARTEPEAQGAVVAARVPNPRPPVLIYLRAAGGTSAWPTLDRPRLAVQVWHTSEGDAAALAQLVRGLLHTAAGRGPVRRVTDFSGPAPIPDPESGAARYLFTVEMTLRGALA